jgi:dTDP-glucose pyrophosphorylase
MSFRGDKLAEIKLPPDARVSELVTAVDRGGIGLALLVDGGGRLLRTVTDGDIRRAMMAGVALSDPASALPPANSGRGGGQSVSAPAGTPVHELLAVMTTLKIRHIPLVDRLGRVCDVALLGDLIEEAEPPLQAVVMAGGFGTRLRPLTEALPKPMLPVGDRPIIEHIVRQMQLSGIRHIDITTHYLADKIKAHLGDGRDLGVEINYVTERDPLGTAGALALIPHAGKTTLVMNGDILTRIDFRAMYDFHSDHDAELTVAVCPYEVRVPYGVVRCAGNVVTDLREKPTFIHMVNAGIYLLEHSVFDLIPRGQPCNMTALIDKLVAAGRTVAAFPIREYWLDIGQHADYLRAQEDARYGRLSA